jgi:hypothetical protein
MRSVRSVQRACTSYDYSRSLRFAYVGPCTASLPAALSDRGLLSRWPQRCGTTLRPSFDSRWRRNHTRLACGQKPVALVEISRTEARVCTSTAAVQGPRPQDTLRAAPVPIRRVAPERAPPVQSDAPLPRCRARRRLGHAIQWAGAYSVTGTSTSVSMDSMKMGNSDASGALGVCPGPLSPVPRMAEAGAARRRAAPRQLNTARAFIARSGHT